MHDPEQVIRDMAAFLDEHRVLSLATVDGDGPHAASLYFACDDRLNLYFVSHPSAAHCRNILESSAVAATAFASVEMWQQVCGIQVRGHCRPIATDHYEHANELLCVKFPGMGGVKEHIDHCQIYSITPSWMRWIDNRVRFGHKIELHWPWPPRIEFREYDDGFVC